MKVHANYYKILLLPLYYLIHKNFVFGTLHKYFFKYFHYKNFKFELNIKNLPTENRSSFLFKTYEYNDRKLIERHIEKKNKCIIIGGGIGFIPVITYQLSKNKILVFEINKNIIKNLKKNLIINKCKFKIYQKNLVINNYNKKSSFYLSNDFLQSSMYLKSRNKVFVNNIQFSQLNNLTKFNTLIIDGEGVEEYFILNIDKLKYINYIFFELHHNLIKSSKIEEMFKVLKKNNFHKKDKCFNSYFFERKK